MSGPQPGIGRERFERGSPTHHNRNPFISWAEVPLKTSGCAVLEMQALRTRTVGDDRGDRTDLVRPKYIGTRKNAIVHHYRDIEIDVHCPLRGPVHYRDVSFRYA